MQIFQSTSNQNNFKFNGLTYPKNFMCIKQGSTNIAVHNAYDTKHQLMSSTHYSEIQVNGVIYSSQEELMAALSTILFAKSFNYVVQDLDATRLLSIGNITVNTNYLTIEPAEWIINGIDFETTSNSVLTVPFAATGKKRIDIIVGNSANQIQRISGNETTGIAVAPITPIDNVYITQLSVNDNALVNPVPPITGSLFVQKEEFSENTIVSTGVIVLKLTSLSTGFRLFGGSVNTITGFDANASFFGSAFYVGKEVKIVNKQSNPILLKHNQLSVNFPMIFPDGNDLQILPNEVAIFKLIKTTSLIAEFISLNRTTYSTTGISTDTFVTGGTYSSNKVVFKNNTGGTFSVSGFTAPFTGGTVNGPTSFTNGVTVNTISATTYFGLPTLNLSGYVPYVNATQNLNLGNFNLQTKAGIVIKNFSNDNVTVDIFNDEENVGVLAIKNPLNSTSVQVLSDRFNFGKNIDYSYWFRPNLSKPSGDYILATIDDIPNLSGYVPYEGATTDVQLREFGLESRWGYGYAKFGTPNGNRNQKEISFRQDGDGIDTSATLSTIFSVNINEGLYFVQLDSGTPVTAFLQAANGIFTTTTQNSNLSTSILAQDNHIIFDVNDGGTNNIFEITPEITTFKKRVQVYEGIEAATYNGYIPYNSTNPAGYVTSSVVNGYLPVASPSFTGLMVGSGVTQTGTAANGVLNLSQTWNTTATPTAIKLNITDNTSNTNSLLIDLQVLGNSKFSVNKNGGLLATTFNSNIIPNVNNSLTVGSSSNQYSSVFSNVFSANGTGILRSGANLIFQVLGGTVEGGRFFNTGNLSIGSALDSGFKLDVVGNTRIQGSLSAASISATTFNGFIPVKTWKSGFDGVTVSTTTTITPTYTQLIPAGTFVAGDVVDLLFRTTSPNAKTSQSNVYIYVNTTNNLSTGSPSQLGIFNTTPTGRTVQIERTLAVKGSTTRVVNPAGANATDTVQSAAMTALTIDWTIDQHLIFAIGHTVASSTETLFGDFYRIIKN